MTPSSSNRGRRIVSPCVNCGHTDHYGERCDGPADGDWCACSWPDPSNYSEPPKEGP